MLISRGWTTSPLNVLPFPPFSMVIAWFCFVTLFSLHVFCGMLGLGVWSLCISIGLCTRYWACLPLFTEYFVAGIYSPNAYRGFAREFIKDLERMRLLFCLLSLSVSLKQDSIFYFWDSSSSLIFVFGRGGTNMPMDLCSSCCICYCMQVETVCSKYLVIFLYISLCVTLLIVVD